MIIDLTAGLISDMIHKKYPYWRKKLKRQNEISVIIRRLIDFELPVRRIAHSLLKAPFVPAEIKQTLALKLGCSTQNEIDENAVLEDLKPGANFVYLSAVAAFATPLVPAGFSTREVLTEEDAASIIAVRFVDALRWLMTNGFVESEH